MMFEIIQAIALLMCIASFGYYLYIAGKIKCMIKVISILIEEESKKGGSHEADD